MADIVIRQSGKRGNGFFIALIVLAVLAVARWGPRLGRIEDRERERERVAKILENTGEDLKDVRRAMEESNSAGQALEAIRKAASENSKAQQD